VLFLNVFETDLQPYLFCIIAIYRDFSFFYLEVYAVVVSRRLLCFSKNMNEYQCQASNIYPPVRSCCWYTRLSNHL